MSPRIKDHPNGTEPSEFPTLKEGRYSQSLERGLAILNCFTPERPTLGIAEIADGLGMSRSTTHRYVTTLVSLGFLKQDAGHRYYLSLRVADIGMSALHSMDLRDHAGTYLEDLRRSSGYTVNLAVLDGPEILYIVRARSLRRAQRGIDLDLRPGSRLPAYCTSIGKVLLAYLSETEQQRLISELELSSRRPNTIVTETALLDELNHVLDAGFATNDEELKSGLISMAVPIRDHTREIIAAVNMAADASMISLEDLVDALGPHLISVADTISNRLGYRREVSARSGN
jgi:IclR family transcriptional regulator, pca regulon regulatory protein